MDSVTKWLFVACFFLYILYKYGTRNFQYWKKKGIRQLRPIPFLGNDLFGIVTWKNPLESSIEVYNAFKTERFGGVYVGQKSFLLVTDPELLKQIMIKDADSFFNRHDWMVNSDPIMKKNLVSLKDESWKKMRTVMSTVFTSSKMKDMFSFMDKCAQQGVQYLEEITAKELKELKSGRDYYEFDCKDFFSRYGTDVIATTAFGFVLDSFRNPNNEFFQSGFIVRNSFRGWRMFKSNFMMMFPRISEKLGLTFFGEKYNKFFISLVSDTIREREEKNIVRKDVIHILMEARKGKGVNEDGYMIKGKIPDLTETDIAAQALLFFFGGFETIATLLGFVTYELALNPDVQEKLQKEIDEVIEKENGITYDGVMHQMQYLNMVVNETLRKWPPAVFTDRNVSKTYVIPKTERSPEIVLDKGDKVFIPIAGLHYNPEYFPDPEKFDPERFRDEKNDIKPFTYLPFGEGPRHCVGKRYALLEAKTVLVHLFKRFSVAPTARTGIPIKLKNKGVFTLEPVSDFWLGLKPRA